MATVVPQISPASVPSRFEKPTLFDVPISNNGGRCRFVIYKKNIERLVAIESPKVLGGLKSEAYLALNPQGLMPLLALPDGTSLPESQVIAAYLADKYRDEGASFDLPTPELRAKDMLVQRIHDQYIAPIQGAMYKDMEVAQRAKAIERLAFQLDVLNGLVKGPYVGGDHLGLADAALFPTLTFMRFILPQFFGWEDLFVHRQQLGHYWAAIEADPVGAKVINEIESGLESWKEAGRWEERGIMDQVAQKDYRWSF
ncbi:glutathione S-transferase [Coccomyxa subellipsoidea C-169]|uniref:Glutathione S-transferase n=1 Tax=Coccomyxa subellipsoidea (strain C-169) TaxID=574566 RepID=I0Z602_COCSC|nr:glutathione S-transferase [Coccomyxa subellipsoidea C-169]EIE26071.1 glutathione S-transferase [Coccomyxa subellipsoidea C-169]|eukprot:XP_005650615.1 glutathione S-transferase [Coccomyxa subellipsoidea C-169]